MKKNENNRKERQDAAFEEVIAAETREIEPGYKTKNNKDIKACTN